jgi:hypothetical protein
MNGIDHAERREAQARKARRGMQVSNRSLKTVVYPTIIKKAKEAAK